MSSKITNPFSEKELVEEIRGGNKNAFQILFYEYYKKLVDFCLYRINNLEGSKDLVQELFTIIWETRIRLDPEKPIKPYLYKALTNQIINFSKHSSAKTYSLDESYYKIKVDEIDKLDSNIDFYTALESLPEKLKTVFMLSRIEQFKYSEIAEILNISVKGIEKRMTKALKLLRKKIVE